MRFFAPLLVVISLAVAAPAIATEPEEASKAKTEKVGKAEPKKICRRIASDMNSRRTARICKTKEEWREFNRGQ